MFDIVLDTPPISTMFMAATLNTLLKIYFTKLITSLIQGIKALCFFPIEERRFT